ncbi:MULTISPECIES: ESX secretion-associated protein EspG [Amycolatopsis]|uniref:ESAT-6 protein secretion system EspG family protein n=2 Tax=Amycolatopsis TaxID=1813 RepID=A0A2A9FCZ5_9PSEU|nr:MULTISPECIES: ESX secretion-associated protein EspG [Amycolatopsis]PFG48823.1 ESAT-6 protein secretion system EspG family protein [Amycolatopsis sulphurea]RJQ88599.1 ESX secretion-associated protein EspG [Amycolatopsis panacis]
MHQEFFSPLAFDFLWESMELGELPYPLRIHSHGATQDERVSLRHRVDTELKARGLRDARGRAEPRLEDWLTLLARAPVSLDGLHIPQFEAHPVALLAAGDERTGVVAIQDADGIWLRETPSDGLVSTIVGLLPAGKRGSEASVTLPLDEALHTRPIRVPVAAGGGQEPQVKGRRPRRQSLSERATVDPRETYGLISGQPRLRGGQLAANSRSSLGARQRSRVLGWFDTSSGRYLSLSRAGSDGREWVTVSPADPQTLRTRLGEMVSSVADSTR